MSRRRAARVQTAAILGGLALATAGAGCGRSDEQKIRDTLATFQRATAAKNYAELCSKVLSKQLVDRLSAVGLPCEVALQRGLASVSSPRLTVQRVRVHGDAALAQVRTSAANQAPSTDTIRLTRQGDDWRVATLSGQQPPRPKPGPD
jgi:hypothetical protein